MKLSKSYANFYTLLPPSQEDGYPHFTFATKLVRDAVPQANLKDATALIDAMRQVKSPGELALLQKAIDVSVDAQLDAMRRMRPGLFEYQVAARMKEIHEMGGCAREAYAPIVGTGFNSTVLHYSGLNDQIKDGDVVVIDVGSEYGGYAADITRTLPANGPRPIGWYVPSAKPRRRIAWARRSLMRDAMPCSPWLGLPGTTTCGRGSESRNALASWNWRWRNGAAGRE